LAGTKRPLFEGLTWELDNKQVVIPSYINCEFKHELSLFLRDYYSSQNINYNYDYKLEILFWDNFCIEFGISKVWCYNFHNSYSGDLYDNLDYLVWRDENGNHKSTLNLLDIKDQELFFDFLLKGNINNVYGI
jgi:hypothetical protein